MGKIKSFEVSLSNAEGVYYGGQTVDGQLHLELNEEMELRGVRVKFIGNAHVRWSETYRSNNSTRTRVYSSEETYFDHVITVFGKAPKQSGDNFKLQKGTYTYNFQFQLPTNIPSSYESHTGRVRYSVSGIIDRIWRFDSKTHRVFTVIYPLDLNTEPTAKEGGEANGSKNLCCLCCTSGPISAMLRVDRIGYVPGESIRINGEIMNSTRRKMKSSFASLNMTVFYHARTKTRRLEQVVGSVYHGVINPGGSDTWYGDTLLIPALPPSRLQGCNIIDIVYTLTLNVDPAGPAIDLKVPLEVLIGSIPLQSVVEQYGPPAPSNYSDVGTPMSHPTIPALPPLTYAASVFGKVDLHNDGDDADEHTRGESEYTPVYSYYNWNR